MRKTICIEGSHPVAGRLLLPDSVKWDGDVPLVWDFKNRIEDVLGRASDIVREDDGRITVELFFNDSTRALDARSLLSEGNLACTIFATEIEEDVTKAPKEVSSCRLRTVSVVTADNVPWE